MAKADEITAANNVLETYGFTEGLTHDRVVLMGLKLDELQAENERLRKALDALEFAEPTTHIYNPLAYAWAGHRSYLEQHADSKKKVIFMGMNPGPFGMAQTGVPFGEISMVRDWMGIEGPVDRPPHEHEKRPVSGFACQRSEVSGKRLWGWARERFGAAEDFFARFFVWNYCPLVFLEESGRNRTPDKLPKHERDTLFAVCDLSLARMVDYLDPQLVLGVGRFAEGRALAALGTEGPRIGTLLHPSPASPLANRGWAPQAERQLAELGVEF